MNHIYNHEYTWFVKQTNYDTNYDGTTNINRKLIKREIGKRIVSTRIKKYICLIIITYV